MALPRIQLTHLPTPLEELSRLRAYLHVATTPRLFIKRDDLTTLAGGGNKVRKLEYLLADAQAKGASAIITTGAAQSNHCRQTAAAAAKLGIDCILVLRGEEPPLETWTGNLFLDEIFGAEIRWTAEHDVQAVVQQAERDCRLQGKTPYVIPVGGSNPIGASAYVAAMQELAQQCAEQGIQPNRIIVTSGSGGTHAGVLVGVKSLGLDIQVEGMDNQGMAIIEDTVRQLATDTTQLLNLDLTFNAADFIFHRACGDHAYGVVTEKERAAVRMLARTEGILLDPVYTGRAFGEMIHLIQSGVYQPQETLIFWHTGGIGGLFGHAAHVLTADG